MRNYQILTNTMRLHLFIGVFILATSNIFAQLTNENITIQKRGWNDSFSARIDKQAQNLKNELLNCEYTKYLSSANLEVIYSNDQAKTSLTIPYSQHMATFSPNWMFGTNGFDSKGISTVMNILYNFQVAFAREDFSLDKKILAAPLTLYIMKDSKNWACFQAFLYISDYYPRLTLSPYFKICNNGKEYMYTSTTSECINVFGYVFGGDITDHLSGEIDSKAKIFATFFNCGNEYNSQRNELLQKEDAIIQKQRAIEEEEQRKKDFQDETIEILSRPKKTYAYSTLKSKPTINFDLVFDSVLIVEKNQYWYKVGTITNKLNLIIDTLGKISDIQLYTYGYGWLSESRYQKLPENEYRKAIEDRLIRHLTINATKEYPLHGVTLPVNWSTEVSLSSDDRFITYLKTVFTFNRKTGAYILKDEKKAISALQSFENKDQIIQDLVSCVNLTYSDKTAKKLVISTRIFNTYLKFTFTDFGQIVSKDMGYKFDLFCE
ncbi:MAG: hypothetical protein MJZ64_08065 [Paludibacteraceae bacterium]|nr:hypothetical protein [Paludibacteraceae bacterium]